MGNAVPRQVFCLLADGISGRQPLERRENSTIFGYQEVTASEKLLKPELDGRIRSRAASGRLLLAAALMHAGRTHARSPQRHRAGSLQTTR
jgi:hypothetical protein